MSVYSEVALALKVYLMSLVWYIGKLLGMKLEQNLSTLCP